MHVSLHHLKKNEIDYAILAYWPDTKIVRKKFGLTYAQFYYRLRKLGLKKTPVCQKKYAKRGRPVGFKLSAETKAKISASKLGSTLKQRTKDKISKTLYTYFRRTKPVTDDLKLAYEDFEDWFDENADKINNDDNIIRVRKNKSHNKEINMGHAIYNFSHDETPEEWLLAKEAVEKKFSAGEKIYNLKEKE